MWYSRALMWRGGRVQDGYLTQPGGGDVQITVSRTEGQARWGRGMGKRPEGPRHREPCDKDPEERECGFGDR